MLSLQHTHVATQAPGPHLTTAMLNTCVPDLAFMAVDPGICAQAREHEALVALLVPLASAASKTPIPPMLPHTPHHVVVWHCVLHAAVPLQLPGQHSMAALDDLRTHDSRLPSISALT